MKPTAPQLQERFQKYFSEYPAVELVLDISRMNFDDCFWRKWSRTFKKRSQRWTNWNAA